jgi:glycolate oxidase FAD binding subunit
MHSAALNRLIDQVCTARAMGGTLAIRGGGTKSFYGERPRGEPLDVRDLAGITSYEPSELFISARAGTPLAELEAVLDEKGQCLAFEPPHFAPGGTVGGMVAAGLSGPSRATAGCVRDHLLGATLVNGRGQVLRFGGQVMKNVAGFDVSRMLAGSLGILGVLCELTLKVSPKPQATETLRFEMGQGQALQALNQWAGRPLPISASSWQAGVLLLRLAGARAAVAAAVHTLGGEVVIPGLAQRHWLQLRHQHGLFFIAARHAPPGHALWRLSVRPTAAPLPLSGTQLIEWGGALRWFVTGEPAKDVRTVAKRAGGHATLFHRREHQTDVFAPLAPPLVRLHQRLKHAFDPEGVFNPGRLYPGL